MTECWSNETSFKNERKYRTLRLLDGSTRKWKKNEPVEPFELMPWMSKRALEQISWKQKSHNVWIRRRRKIFRCRVISPMVTFSTARRRIGLSCLRSGTLRRMDSSPSELWPLEKRRCAKTYQFPHRLKKDHSMKINTFTEDWPGQWLLKGGKAQSG